MLQFTVIRMTKSLALKELRETAWIGGIAAAIFAYFFVYETGYDILFMQPTYRGNGIPFISDSFVNGMTFYLVAGTCAAALGFRQSVWESFRGTYLFLLHRPISQTRLIGVKLAVGVGIYLAVTGLATLAYALWAATPGTHPSPFYWSMTTNEWTVWLSLSVLYFGAFLSGIREARWYATRLLPLLGALLLTALSVAPFGWWFRAASVVVMNSLFVAAILYVARTRDYP
jgi:hypothetical protein